MLLNLDQSILKPYLKLAAHDTYFLGIRLW